MSPGEAHASDCVCGGRGWYLDEEEKTGRCYVARCEFCQRWPNDQLAGKVAYGKIEAGWPK